VPFLDRVIFVFQLDQLFGILELTLSRLYKSKKLFEGFTVKPPHSSDLTFQIVEIVSGLIDEL